MLALMKDLPVDRCVRYHGWTLIHAYWLPSHNGNLPWLVDYERRPRRKGFEETLAPTDKAVF